MRQDSTSPEGPTDRQSALRATIALLVMVVIWGLNFSIAKDALDRIPPLAFNTLRFPLAAAVVTLFMIRRRGLQLPPRADWLRLAGLGILGNVVYQLCFIFGLQNTRAGTASVLLAGTPIVTGFLSAAAGQERVTRGVWFGALATVAGIILVVVTSGTSATAGSDTMLGNALMVAATLSWAAYSVAARPLIERHGPVPVTTWTLWAGATVIVLLGVPATIALDGSATLPRDWFAVVYAGAFSIGIAYVLWSYGIRNLGATRTATFSNLVPVVALSAAWMLLGERPTAGQLTGAAIIISGVTVAQLGRRSARPAGSPSP